MNESFKQALKIALGVVLVINQAVLFYLLFFEQDLVFNNPSRIIYYTIGISLCAYIITLFSAFIWVHAKCKEEKKHDYVLFFKLLSVAIPGLCFGIFDILPQKWIEYINVGLMILIFPFLAIKNSCNSIR